jgi:hypothetical protein
LPVSDIFQSFSSTKQINHAMAASQRQQTPGEAVLAMVLDTLSGNTPLYRLKEFFHEKALPDLQLFRIGRRTLMAIHFFFMDAFCGFG